MVLSDGGTVRVRPIRPDDGAAHPRLPRPAVAREHLLPLLHARTPTCRDRRGRAADPRRLRRPHGVRRPARRRHGRRGPLRPLAAAVRGRGGVLRRRRPPRAGHGHRCCSSTWPPRPGEAGISGFTATVLPTNRRMVAVFRQAGFETSSTLRGGRDRGAARPPAHARGRWRPSRPAAQRAEARGGAPAAGAPVGGGHRRRPRARGAWATRCCATCWPTSFDGPVYPVNRPAEHVGRRAGRAGRSAPSTARVDLAVIVRPGRRGAGGDRGLRAQAGCRR